MKRAVPFALAMLSVACATSLRARPTGAARKDIPTIAKAAKEAIVTIVMRNDAEPIARGTGFFVSPDGQVMTNYHVIEIGNVGVVKLSDGTILPVDGVLATDKAHDLAIIKIHGKTFQTLTLGNSDRIQVGEDVIAIGNPLGLELTVSNGILSGIRTGEKQSGGLLQITAPISHGSSGGPLFNTNGEVIGITAAFLEGGENLNFAIPINEAKHLISNKSAGLLGLPNGQPNNSSRTKGDGKRDDLAETLNWMRDSLDTIGKDGGGIVGYAGSVTSTTLIDYSGCKVHFRNTEQRLDPKNPGRLDTVYSNDMVFNLGDIDPDTILTEPANDHEQGAHSIFSVHTQNNEKRITTSHLDPGDGFGFVLHANYAPRFAKAFKHAVILCGGKASRF